MPQRCQELWKLFVDNVANPPILGYTQYMELIKQTKGENSMKVKAPRMTNTAKFFAGQFIDIHGLDGYLEEGEPSASGEWYVKDTKGNRYPKAVIQQFADFRNYNEANPVHGPAETYREQGKGYWTMDEAASTVHLTNREHVGGFYEFTIRERA